MTRIAPALDIDAVQAFVLVADLCSFTQAAHVLDTSQAAVSLKVKRLETQLGCRLLERTPHKVRLSERGAGFLPGARDLLGAHERARAALVPPPPRRLSLGISDHVAGPELPSLVARLAAHDPALVLEVHVAASRDLVQSYDRGDLDAAIVRREGDRSDGTRLTTERFGWFAAPAFRHQEGAPLRLATLAEPCGVRAIATRLLDEAALSWREVFVGGGIIAVGAAVSVGLGVAALAHRVAPADTIEVGTALRLPPLPAAEIVMHTRRRDARSREALGIVGAAFRAGTR